MQTNELEAVVKSIKDATDAIREASKTATEARQKEVEGLVETTIKAALKKLPSGTQSRKLEFADNMPTSEDQILEQVPKEVQDHMDKVYLASRMLKVHPRSLKMWDGFKKHFESKAGDFKKALDSTTSGGVDEWVPTELSPGLREKVRLALKVWALFPTINMPTNPYELPVEVGNFDSYLQPEQTADTGQTKIPVGDGNNISNKTTFTAKGHATRVLVSKEAQEDSIVPMLPFIQNRIVLALSQGREDILINGDTGTHQDTDTEAGASNLRRRLTKGLRAHALENSYTTDLSTLSHTNMLLMREEMGVYGVNPGELAWITSIKGYIKILAALEDQIVTIDKLGPNALILTGQLAQVDGAPLVVSEWMRQDLDSTGVNGASGNTKTAMLLVNRNGFGTGERRRATTQLLQEIYAESGQDALIATERIDVQPFFPIASNAPVWYGYNIG